jgi:intracellular multiplication protein IcmE
MASEQDAGRDKKAIFGVILGLVVIIAGGVYLLRDWFFKPPEHPSQVNLERVSGSVPGKTSETPAYRAQLDQFNRQGAAQAQAENNSFIASLKLEQQPVSPPVNKTAATSASPANATQSNQQNSSSSSGTTSKEDEVRLTALTTFLDKLKPSTGKLQIAQILGSSDGGQGGSGASEGGGGSSYQSWSQSLSGGMRTVAATSRDSAVNANGSAAPVVPIEVIPPYWRGPGYIDIGVDSDNSTTPVLGKIGTGTYAGAVLKASDGAKLTGEGVVIHFTEMAYKGINYKVDAYALQEDSLLANVATDVNHRYMSRIVLPALLSGIGGIGELYSQANTQLVSNGFNSQVVRPSLPDGAAVAGSIAGGAAGQAAKVLTEDAQRVPATQVTVTKGQVVAIQFMRGVYSGDAIAPGQGGDAVKAAVSVQSSRQDTSQPVTDDQWRAVARQQIQAQQAQREFNR